ncbi:hypothetical protein FISHEDRAFT_62243 [Fistulina hepatica ATCC 64428]|nr:hypothetical protein FISHEDRAFT_62243 [Fistulina hepatica ATCC 64428]
MSTDGIGRHMRRTISNRALRAEQDVLDIPHVTTKKTWSMRENTSLFDDKTYLSATPISLQRILKSATKKQSTTVELGAPRRGRYASRSYARIALGSRWDTACLKVASTKMPISLRRFGKRHGLALANKRKSVRCLPKGKWPQTQGSGCGASNTHDPNVQARDRSLGPVSVLNRSLNALRSRLWMGVRDKSCG